MTASGQETADVKKLERCPSNAAMKVQKCYRSYRTRRMLADSAVVAEEVAFFKVSEPELESIEYWPWGLWNCLSLQLYLYQALV